jgi:acetolactate synthase-1/2/3 large subunit
LIESAADVDIKPIVPRQERTGIHMADAYSRVTSGNEIGVFCMQLGPGAENAFGGVAQAYSESAPVVVFPMGYDRNKLHRSPNFDATRNYREITKSSERIILPDEVTGAVRRAFNEVRTGRPRPALVEVPFDLFDEDVPDIEYKSPSTTRTAPSSDAVSEAIVRVTKADRPVIYAGQGIHYAEAWDELLTFAELVGAPVATSLQGKSAFPEHHPQSLGAAGNSMPQPVFDFIHDSDLVFGVGCSFTETHYGISLPPGKPIVHATLDPADVNKNIPADIAVIGDAKLTLSRLIDQLHARSDDPPLLDVDRITTEIERQHDSWRDEWRPKLVSDETPLTPYRVIHDLWKTVSLENTIITHDAGSPRDQLAPFWEAQTPLTYLGWGKTTQLGYGLGLAMGAKLARPDALCINVWGDAAIGFTGMDLETAVREEIPILSILFNNFSMAMEIEHMEVSTQKYGTTDISGNYADMMTAFGGYGERIEQPAQIRPAIERGIEKTESGTPALLEFITKKETEYSIPD